MKVFNFSPLNIEKNFDQKCANFILNYIYDERIHSDMVCSKDESVVSLGLTKVGGLDVETNRDRDRERP